MQGLRATAATIAIAAALVAAPGLLPGAARAAETVDITYDLSESTAEALAGAALDKVLFVSNDNPINGTIAGSMKLRYAGTSQSSMPIQPGPVELLSFDLRVQSFAARQLRFSGTGPLGTNPSELDASFHWQLTGGTPQGSLTSGGALTGLLGALHLTGTVTCHPAFPAPTRTYACSGFFGLPYGSTTVDRVRSGLFALAGSAGPYGGAYSTRHTLTGGAGAAAVAFLPAFALNSNLTHNGFGGWQLVGREVRREAEGHETRVIPEPGTLLLLGAGAAGLALVGRATRHSRER